MKKEYEDRFRSYPSTSQKRTEIHDRVRKETRDLCEILVGYLEAAPREQAIVVKLLEDAMMWTNMGVARSWPAVGE